MEYLKIILIASAVLFLALLLKTGLWRRIPFVSAVFSVLLFAGTIVAGILIGSVIIFIILGVIGFLLILFILFWIFGRARFYKMSGKGFATRNEKANKKPKVKVLK